MSVRGSEMACKIECVRRIDGRRMERRIGDRRTSGFDESYRSSEHNDLIYDLYEDCSCRGLVW